MYVKINWFSNNWTEVLNAARNTVNKKKYR